MNTMQILRSAGHCKAKGAWKSNHPRSRALSNRANLLSGLPFSSADKKILVSSQPATPQKKAKFHCLELFGFRDNVQISWICKVVSRIFKGAAGHLAGQGWEASPARPAGRILGEPGCEFNWAVWCLGNGCASLLLLLNTNSY